MILVTTHGEVVESQQLVYAYLMINFDVSFFNLIVPERANVPPAIVIVAECKLVANSILYSFLDLDVATANWHLKGLGVRRPKQVLAHEVFLVTALRHCNDPLLIISYYYGHKRLCRLNIRLLNHILEYRVIFFETAHVT